MRVVFLGTPDWAVPSLEALVASRHDVVAVVTAPDRPVGRSRTPKPTPVKVAALATGLPALLQPETLRGRETRANILAFRPEFLAVVAYGKLLPGRLLDAPEHGAVNRPVSLLPRHRGASPVQHTLLLGDPLAGVTTMRMDRGLDTGPLLLQRELELLPGERSPELGQRLAQVGAPLLVKTLDQLEDGNLEPREQDESLATHAPLLVREQGYVDWSRSAIEIERQARAFADWPAVVCEGPKGRIRLLRVESRPQIPDSVKSVGSVLRREGELLLVACGGGSVLALAEVQPAGSRAMTASAALAGGYVTMSEPLRSVNGEDLEPGT